MILPAGFTITSGVNPQNIGNVNWNSPKTATWTVIAPDTSGSYTLDVEVWSDNLGVAVDDPDDPYHKFEVDVFGHFWVLIELIHKFFARRFWFYRQR